MREPVAVRPISTRLAIVCSFVMLVTLRPLDQLCKGEGEIQRVVLRMVQSHGHRTNIPLRTRTGTQSERIALRRPWPLLDQERRSDQTSSGCSPDWRSPESLSLTNRADSVGSGN